jgi:hypothetical protein
MTWSIVGIVTSLAVLGVAGWRMRRPAGFYDGAVYGMTRDTHRRYFGLELLLLLAFFATAIVHAGSVTIWLLAFAVLVAVFYLTSFLRGASEEE